MEVAKPTVPSFPCRNNIPKTVRSASQPTGALPSSSALPVTPAAPTVAKRASSTGSIPDDRLNLLDALIGKAKAIRHRNKLPSAPAEARPCASSDGPASAP